MILSYFLSLSTVPYVPLGTKEYNCTVLDTVKMKSVSPVLVQPGIDTRVPVLYYVVLVSVQFYRNISINGTENN